MCQGVPTRRPFCETVKMKPGLHWRTHDVGAVRAKESFRLGVERAQDKEVCCNQG